MKLKDFVTQSLVDILEGIKDAQQKEVGCFVSPSSIGNHNFPENRRVENSQRIQSTVVEFDVAISAETEDEGQAKVGFINVISGSLGAKLNTKETNVSRIKFSVPIIFPENRKKWHE